MRRVVVTGLGVVSSIGNNKAEVLDSLKAGRSGIRFSETYAEMGFRSHVHGDIKLDPADLLDRKVRRFLGDGAAFNYIAMAEAIEDAGLGETEISNEPTGLIMGPAGPPTSHPLRPTPPPSRPLRRPQPAPARGAGSPAPRRPSCHS